MRLFLAHHANVHAVSNVQLSVMHFACWGQSTACVKLLADKGAAIDLPDNQGWKPLHVAAERPNLDIVRFLLDQGADINDTSCSYQTPTINAIVKKERDVVRLLVERGANVALTGLDGGIAIDRALDSGDQNIISLLLENGGFHEFSAPESTSNPKGDPSLDTGSPSDLPLEAYKSIINGTESTFLADLSVLNPSTTPSKALDASLLISVALNSLQLVRALLDKGADPSCRSVHRRTPLHLAARQSSASVLQILLKHGVSVHSRDTVGSTTLHQAT